MKTTIEPDAQPRQPVTLMAFPTITSRLLWTTEKLCMPCAVKNPDFKERAPSPTVTPFEEANMRAWIYGRAFELVRHPSGMLICARCGQEVQVAYTPRNDRLHRSSTFLTEN